MSRASERPQPTDYVTDEGYGEGWAQLLNFDSTAKADGLPAPWAPLAEMALAVHQQSPRLSDGQLEQVIGWLKRAKAARGRFGDGLRPTGDMFKRLEALRISTRQVALQREAVKAIRWETLYGALLAATVAISALCWSPDWRWYHYLIPAFFVWWFAGARNAQKVVVAMRWKAQDREYFLDCLRESRTVAELCEAGLFAHPDTLLVPGQPWDQKASVARMRQLRGKLADALYLDPEQYLGSTRE